MTDGQGDIARLVPVFISTDKEMDRIGTILVEAGGRAYAGVVRES